MRSKCENCGRMWEITDDDIIILMPYPHVICPKCGGWIPAF